MDRGHGRVVRGALILAAAVLAAAIAPESMAQSRDPLPWRPEALATVVPDPSVAAR